MGSRRAFFIQAGFVFSKQQVERRARELTLQNPAYYAFHPRSQADPPPAEATIARSVLSARFLRLIDWLAVTRKFFPLLLLSAAAYAQPPASEAARPGARGSVEGRLTWFDRQGNKVGTVGDPGVYRTLSISPDAKRVAVERTDPQTQNRDIWLLDSAGGASTRFTSDPGWDAFPLWSPDGSRIIFTSNRDGGVFNLYEKPSNGSGNEKLLYKSAESKGPTSWSPDGKFLIYYSLGNPLTCGCWPPTDPRTARPSLWLIRNTTASRDGSRRMAAGWFTLPTNRERVKFPYARLMRPQALRAIL